MKLTNNYNLTESYVQAVTRNTYDRVGDISITGLIQPPRVRILTKRHDAEIVQDVSELVWLLLGSSVHAILERTDPDNHLVEERMTTEVNGWVISGKPDLLDPGMTLSDWKVTSVWSFIFGEKPEWTQQLNFYRWLYSSCDFDVRKLQIVAILRDWQKSTAKREPEYPQTAIYRTEIPMLGMDDVRVQIIQRVLIHQSNEQLPDDKLDLCTPEERWAKQTTYAVKKETNKTALRVFDNMEQAEALLAEKGKGFIIETRPGANIRCEDYCLAAPFCNFYKSMKNAST